MTFLTRSSLRNRLIVGLLTLSVAVAGLFAMNSLKQELMPPMDVPMAFVSVTAEGIAPEEMVRVATDPVESALEAVPGVTRVTSTTSTGVAELIVEWPFESDADETLQAIRGAADALSSALPAGAEVEVFSGGMDGAPAMVLSAGAKGEADAGFSEALEQTVVPALQGVSGVQRVVLAGIEESRLVIDLRPADIDRLRVEPSMIPPVVQAHGASIPAGSAQTAEGRISVSVGEGLGSVEQVAALPIPVADGTIALSEVADVHLETIPAQTVSRVNGNPAFTLQVMPASGANVVDISHGVQAELDRLSRELDAEFVSLFDQAPYIEQSIHDLSVEGGLGLLFAVIVILAFLWSWRSTVIAALSIPLSLLITLLGLLWSENTLNILTLGALTIAIGRVVDDSIVVIENISRRAKTGPLSVEGIVASVRQVAGAITASTLTTVAVFLPIAFVSGMAGQLFRPFAITVSIALLSSLLVSLTIVPVLAYWFLRRQAATDADRQDTGERAEADSTEGDEEDPARELADDSERAEVLAPLGFVAEEEDALGAAETQVTGKPRRRTREEQGPSSTLPDGVDPHSDLAELHAPSDRLQRALMPPLNATRRHPVLTTIAAAVLLVVTVTMSGMLRTDFLGSAGAEMLQLTQTPQDADDPLAAAEPVEQALAGVRGVRDVITTVPLGSVRAGEPVEISHQLQLEDGADATKVEAAVQTRLDALDGAGEFELLQVAGSSGSGDIALQIRGDDPAALQEASDLLQERLQKADGVQAASSDISGDQPVVRVVLDEPRAAALGFDRTQVATAVQQALGGTVIGDIRLEGRTHAIAVRTAGVDGTAEKLPELLLPVTAQQTAQAQERASDDLQQRAEEKAAQQRAEAADDLASQVNEAYDQRAELVAQLGELQQQLAALLEAPVVPGPALGPKDQATLRAQEERAAQIAALQQAIASADAGVSGIDEQVTQLERAQSDQADAVAEQEAATAEQEQLKDVRGAAIRLGEIAEVREERTAPRISRADGERQVTLSVTPREGMLEAAMVAVDAAIDETALPAGVTFELGGVSAEQEDAFGQLGMAMLAAIGLVLLVMIATFRSFRQPLVLLISIPFAATGAIAGLLLTDTPLGLPALIGMLMLIGIVVTNAIVLMDLIGRLRADGASLEDAVEHGTRLRLRPILMTAAATVFALIPMSLGLTGGGVFISRPLAIVVIGGLVSSTLLTLILVPVLYTMVERGRMRRIERRKARRARRAARRAQGAAASRQAPAEAVGAGSGEAEPRG